MASDDRCPCGHRWSTHMAGNKQAEHKPGHLWCSWDTCKKHNGWCSAKNIPDRWKYILGLKVR